MTKNAIIIKFGLTTFLILFYMLAVSCTSKPVTAEDPTAVVGTLGTEPNRQPTNDPRPGPTIPDDQGGIEASCSAGLEQAPKEIFLKYKAYSVSYNPKLRIPNWVAHEIYKEGLEVNCGKRAKDFKPDLRLRDQFHLEPVMTKAYTNTGFDRGHQAPAGDFNYKQDTAEESFRTTNIVPQTPDLNQGSWEKLESRIRLWGCGNGHLKVITGPVLTSPPQRLSSCVAVPQQFFKVVLSDKSGAFKAIGFIYSQSDGRADIWKERAMTVKEVEKVTGLTFFEEFPTDLAESFKTKIDLEAWEKSEVKCQATCATERGAQPLPPADPASDAGAGI